MDRRKFVQTGSLSCAALCLGGKNIFAVNTDGGTPCDKKVEFSQQWIKRFVDLMDKELEIETKEKLLEHNGKQCYDDYLNNIGYTPDTVPKRTPEEIVTRWNNYAGEKAASYDNGILYVRYTKNPDGLKVSDGFCLCPLVESGPEGLSGTYCHCSIGYVKEMFQLWLKQDVKVELLESLKRGGKSCSFKIILS